MPKFHHLIALGLFIICQTKVFSAEDLWRIRPLPIIEGKTEPHAPLISSENQEWKKWKIESELDVELTASEERKLWRESVVKLSWKNGDKNNPGKISLTPQNKPIAKGPANSIDFWIHGPDRCDPKLIITLLDADQKEWSIHMTFPVSNWANKGYWSMAHAALPEGIKFPVSLTGITFDEIKSKNDYLYFDSLSLYQHNGRKNYPSVDFSNLPFPTTPDTILPTCKADKFSNTASISGDTYSFNYEGPDTEIEYAYTPRTGTLGDLKVRAGKNFEFKPAWGGGALAKVDDVYFSPEDKDIKAILASKSFDAENCSLKTRWRLKKNNRTLKLALSFGIKGKSLIIDAYSPGKDVYAFKFGRTLGTPEPKLFSVPFFDCRFSTPKILYSNGIFVSALFDWYQSNASYLIDGETGYKCLLNKDAELFSKDSAFCTRGTLYESKTDGNRNNMHERIFLTVSPDFQEVIPNIPNPKSENEDITRSLICCTRMYPMVKPGDWRYEVGLWKKLKTYGLEHIFVRYHSEFYRTPLECMELQMSDTAGKYYGGDEVLKKMVGELKLLDYYVGTYTNYRQVHPQNKDFSPDLVTLLKNGKWDIKGAAYHLKPALQEKYRKLWSSRIKDKFGWNSVYFDECTNTPPWGLVDYDSRVPGAGKFVSTFKHIGELLLNEKKCFGPVWSEGNSHYMWAGLADINYAQNCHPDQPTLVDFQLLKIHTLENDTGVDLKVCNQKDTDWKLATQIVYGNIGHLWGKGLMLGRADKFKDYRTVLKTYFMMQQLQEYYAMINPVKILYNGQDKMLDTNKAIANDSYKQSQVYVKYASGLETWVNRNQSENWKVILKDKEYMLPPNGYLAVVADKFLEYSSSVNDNRVDFVKGKNYLYCDGRGKTTDFGDIVGAEAYIIKQADGKTILTPAPFISGETLILKGIKTPVKINAFAEDGSKSGSEIIYDIKTDGLHLTVDKEFFKYEITFEQ